MAYTIWTTGCCNLKCKYCYEGINKPNQHMTSEVAEAAWEFIRQDFDCNKDDEFLMNFHGGEPFLNFPIIKYFVKQCEEEYLSKCKIAFTATTNVTLIDGEILDYIKEKNIELTISIDGAKETHDDLRKFANGAGSHDVVIKNSLRLLKDTPNMRVRMTFTPDTVSDLSENVLYLLDNGFKTLAPGIDSFDNRWDEAHIKVLEEEIEKMKRFLPKYKDAVVGLCDELSYCGKSCKGGIASKHIYYDGSIYPCMVTGGNEEFIIGTVESGIDVNKRNELLKYSLYDNDVCSGCDLDVFCSGARCKIINKMKTGDFYTPALIECNLTHLLYNLNGFSLPA